MIEHIHSKENLHAVVQAAGSKPVVIEFYAQWSGPCKMIASNLKELTKQYEKEIVVLKVDVDECGELAVDFGITNTPTFIVQKGDRIIDKFSGADYELLKSVIESNK